MDGKRRVSVVLPDDLSAERLVRPEKSRGGSGGMATKLNAARSAASRGIATVIADGKNPDLLRHIITGDDVGTLLVPVAEGMGSRAHWIAPTLRPKGPVVVDAGPLGRLLA